MRWESDDEKSDKGEKEEDDIDVDVLYLHWYSIFMLSLLSNCIGANIDTER